jgi:predicted lipid-binding transport protein (Tim44 family)
MNKKVVLTATGMTLAGMLSSCTTTQMNGAVAGLAGGLVGGAVLGHGHGAGNVIAAIAAAAITVAIIQHYQASQEQKRYAQYRAAQAAQRPHYAAAKQQKKVRYVAVPVSKKSEKDKAGIMLYDTDKGRLASDEVYVPKASSSSSMKKDTIVTVDGKQAMLESNFYGS